VHVVVNGSIENITWHVRSCCNSNRQPQAHSKYRADFENSEKKWVLTSNIIQRSEYTKGKKHLMCAYSENLLNPNPNLKSKSEIWIAWSEMSISQARTYGTPYKPVISGVNTKGKPQSRQKCKLCVSTIVADLTTCRRHLEFSHFVRSSLNS